MANITPWISPCAMVSTMNATKTLLFLLCPRWWNATNPQLLCYSAEPIHYQVKHFFRKLFQVNAKLYTHALNSSTNRNFWPRVYAKLVQQIRLTLSIEMWFCSFVDFFRLRVPSEIPDMQRLMNEAGHRDQFV